MAHELKRIMFYVDTLGGGAERVITNLASKFADHGYEVLIRTTVKSAVEYKIPDNVKLTVLQAQMSTRETPLFIRIKRKFARFLEVRRDIKAHDIVLSFMRDCNIRALIRAFGLKTKMIISVRADPKFEYQGVKGWLYSRLLLPFADGCVFQTQDAKSWFTKKLQDKSVVLFNEVKPEFFNIKREPVKGEIINIGRLDPQKNQKMLIKAVSMLHEKYPDLKLKIYGEGSLRSELEDYIKSLNAESFVKLMGWTHDIGDAFARAEMFILSSDFEGVSNALMEALAAGVPSISTDCPPGGSKMLIDNMKDGMLVPVGDADALAQAIEFLHANPDKAKLIGENAKKRAQNFEPEKVFKDWENYFIKIFNN